MPSSNTELLFVLPGGAENQRPSVLASLRTAEALKPVLPRVVLAHTWLPGALRAGEGPNGWGENRGHSHACGHGLHFPNIPLALCSPITVCKDAVAKHHDVLVKEAFSSVEDAAAEFRAILPEELVRALDLKKLTLVPGSFRKKELAESHTDILYSVPLGASFALVYVLFEHKSDSDRWTALQLLGYMLDIWESFRKNNPAATLLPPIIPLVLHHSPAGWSRSASFSSLFDPELLAIPGVTEGLPTFHFHLDDISHISEGELRARAFSAFSTLALASLSRSRGGSESDFLEALAPLADLFVQLLSAPDGPRALRILFEYISRVAPGVSPQDLERYLAEKSPDVQDLAMTIAEQIKQEGIVQGREEGRVEGIVQGQALSLLKQLKLKFGSVPITVESDILAASPERLDLYLERILTAQSIADVLRS